MLRKLTILAVAVLAIAAIIMVVSSFVGSPQPVDSSNVTITEDDAPSKLGTETGVGRTTDMHVIILDENTGELSQEYFATSTDPQPGGVWDVVKPRARFHLSPRRVIEMQADTGQFIAPANRPQRGWLRGNVIIMVYEAPRGVALDLSPQSTHMALRLQLDKDASFDATLGKIESDGPLKLVAPGQAPHQVEFVGEGLVMVYNEPESRVDYLEIRHGTHLKYFASAQRPPSTEAAEGAAGAEQPNADGQLADVQYYRVTFTENVRVASEGQSIDADDLELMFGFSKSKVTERTTNRAPASAFGTSFALGRAFNPMPLVLGQNDVPAKSSGHPLLADLGDKDVTVTWTGPMVMKPLQGKPVELNSPDDLLLTFNGQPVVARTAEGDRIACRKLTYLDSAQELRATGSPAHPLVISGPSLGTAEAEELAVRLDTNTAKLFGKGQLQGTPAGSANAGKGLPEGFNVRWTDRLELQLAKADAGSLESAAFYGNVDLSDPRVKVKADELHANFKPAGKRDEPQLEQFHATGGVDIKTDDGRIRAGDLEVFTRVDGEGDLVPHKVNAKGGVHVEDPTQNFTAGAMEVVLGDDPQTKPDDKRMFKQRVVSMTAWEDVQLAMEKDTTITADRLEADAAKRTAELLGSPVKVVRGESELHVLKLNLTDDGRNASAAGAGSFIYTEADEPLKPGRKVNVTWTDSMTYSDTGNRIDVAGDVVAEASDAPTELNRLSAGKLTLDLTDAPKTDDAADAGKRILKKVTAKNNVVLLARTWTDATRTHMQLRLRATGPILEFDNATERATITGPGTLLAEDYRADQAERPIASVNITGRGATLFTWSRSMAMDGTNTALVIEGNAQMSHWPAAETGDVDLSTPPVADLQCNTMTADMVGIGGMQAMRMSDSKSLKLDQFTADGRVQLRHRQSGRDRMVNCGKLVYDGKSQVVDLTAVPGRQVEIIDAEQPKPARAQAVRWDLQKDRLELKNTGF